MVTVEDSLAMVMSPDRICSIKGENSFDSKVWKSSGMYGECRYLCLVPKKGKLTKHTLFGVSE